MGDVSSPHSGPYLAAEGETWVAFGHYEELLAERDRLVEQKETLDNALRDILDVVENWTRFRHADAKLAAIDGIAKTALSNPASGPLSTEGSMSSPVHNQDRDPAREPEPMTAAEWVAAGMPRDDQNQDTREGR